MKKVQEAKGKSKNRYKGIWANLIGLKVPDVLVHTAEENCCFHPLQWPGSSHTGWEQVQHLMHQRASKQPHSWLAGEEGRGKKFHNKWSEKPKEKENSKRLGWDGETSRSTLQGLFFEGKLHCDATVWECRTDPQQQMCYFSCIKVQLFQIKNT